MLYTICLAVIASVSEENESIIGYLMTFILVTIITNIIIGGGLIYISTQPPFRGETPFDRCREILPGPLLCENVATFYVYFTLCVKGHYIPNTPLQIILFIHFIIYGLAIGIIILNGCVKVFGNKIAHILKTFFEIPIDMSVQSPNLPSVLENFEINSEIEMSIISV